MALVNKVGDLAEEEGHHPDITFGWGYCTVLFYTHKIKGLHENDFIMAAKVDALAGGLGTARCRAPWKTSMMLTSASSQVYTTM